MRILIFILTVILLCSCKHNWVGQRSKMNHYLEPQGHETVDIHPKFIVDYDYRIVNNEINVEGIFTCKDDAELNTWNNAEIKLYFLFLDEKGIVLEVERVSITAPELCRENIFRRSFPYKKEYKAVKLSFKAKARG